MNNYRKKVLTRKKFKAPECKIFKRLVPVRATVTGWNSSQTFFVSHIVNISSETEFTKIWDYTESMWNIHKARPLKHQSLVSTGFSNLASIWYPDYNSISGVDPKEHQKLSFWFNRNRPTKESWNSRSEWISTGY